MVDESGFRVFLCETNTGRVSLDLPAAGQTWGMRLNKSGTVGVSFRPGAEEFQGLNIRGNTRLLAQSLGVAYNGRILECGPIWTRDYVNGTMSLSADNLRSLFEGRKAVAGAMLLPGAPITSSPLTITGSLGDIARELVRISLYDNPHLPGPLNNVVLPPVQGGNHTRTYEGFELQWIDAALEELSSGQDGIDIRFQPRFMGDDPNRVEWVLQVGDPLLEQAGSDWIWDGGVEGTGLSDLSTHEDASTMAGFGYVPGAGNERTMKLATAHSEAFSDAGYPWLEVDEAAKEIADDGILASKAERLLEDGERPWLTTSVEVRADVSPMLGEYLPGEWARIVVPEGHATLDPGELRVRIMAVDGGSDNKVKLTVAPVQDEQASDGAAGEGIVTSDDPGYVPGSWASLPAGVKWVDLPPGNWRELS